VRAVDPAGNRDALYVMGRNVYNWYYLSPTPWDIILGTVYFYHTMVLLLPAQSSAAKGTKQHCALQFALVLMMSRAGS
jgi:hypothetical protein